MVPRRPGDRRAAARGGRRATDTRPWYRRPLVLDIVSLWLRAWRAVTRRRPRTPDA